MGGGFLENICTGMFKVDFRMLTISIPVYCKNTRSLYLTCMTKPTHLYTIFAEMMTHYYHFHQQNSISSYHHRNKGSLIYLEQFQNHPIGIPKLMKMHLKTFKHSRTPCFREYPPGDNVIKFYLFIRLSIQCFQLPAVPQKQSQSLLNVNLSL